jgi:SAM-dependent methyltransferase
MEKTLDVWLKEANRFLPDRLGKILEVGSMIINPIPVKSAFAEERYDSYTGIDMRPGNGVDVVVNAHDLVDKFGADSFDIVVCIATLEHDDKFWITQDQINKVLKKGGFYLLCVPSIHFHFHRYPDDYWRFTPSGVKLLFEGYEILELVGIGKTLICTVGKKL